MKLIKMEKVKDGKYLKNYNLTYLNKAGKEKVYEIVSHSELKAPEDLGKKASGVSIVAIHQDKLLLLREFRMGVNTFIYNFCAGFIEKGETIEESIDRELYEETGLKVSRIVHIFRPSYVAVGLSDVKNYLAIVEVEGNFEDHTSANEEIYASFYTKEEVKELLLTEEFSSRAQAISYFFTQFDLTEIDDKINGIEEKVKNGIVE